MTQVWVVLITYLILAFLRFKAGLGISFQQLVRLLQINLFDRRNLLALCTPQPPDVVEVSWHGPPNLAGQQWVTSDGDDLQGRFQ